MLTSFLLAFIPLFVAIDALATVPLVVGMTRPLSPAERRRFLLQAIATASLTALAFTLAGQPIFRFLGITVNDFRVGGGILLLIFAIHDLLFKVERLASRRDDTLTGVAPLGVPLIIGPAALSTLLILVGKYGLAWTLISLLLNLLLTWLVLSQAQRVQQVLGKEGTLAISKIMSIFLAAIAVMMVRQGITDMLLDAAKAAAAVAAAKP